jgi:hypothetical protein
MVTGEKSSDGDFVIVVMIKRVSRFCVNPSAIASSTKKPRIPTIGVRSSSSLSVMRQRSAGSLLLPLNFSPEVTTSDVEKFLKDKLKLA